MHRLAQFTVGTVAPEWERILGDNAQVPDSEMPLVILHLIEGFLWMHLGLEIGAFPREESEEVYSFYYQPFFEWLKLYDEKTRHDPSRRPFFETSFFLGLPDFARILVEKAIHGHRPFDDQPSGVGINPRLVGPFQALLILYSLLCRDRSVRQLVYAIGFEWPAKWEEDWNRDAPAEDVFSVMESGEGSVVATVLAGYMKLCAYARNTTEVLENVASLQILDFARLFEFKERVANIQIWRLSLSSRDSARRFDQIRNRINEIIEKELPEIGLENEVARVQQTLENSLNLLFESAIA